MKECEKNYPSWQMQLSTMSPPLAAAVNNKGLGNNTGMGICHSYTEYGRYVSILKILLTNHCIYDFKRSYGIYYDLKTVQMITIEDFSKRNTKISPKN